MSIGPEFGGDTIVDQPTKRPTASEYFVLALFVASVFVVLGGVAILMAWRAPAEKQELARQAMTAGMWLVGIGGVGGVGVWWIRRLMTR